MSGKTGGASQSNDNDEEEEEDEEELLEGSEDLLNDAMEDRLEEQLDLSLDTALTEDEDTFIFSEVEASGSDLDGEEEEDGAPAGKEEEDEDEEEEYTGELNSRGGVMVSRKPEDELQAASEEDWTAMNASEVVEGKLWDDLSKAEMLTLVEDLYDADDDYIRDTALLRARAEMRKDEMMEKDEKAGKGDTEGEEFDVDAEVERLLKFQNQNKQKGKKASQDGIPGEVVEGPPEMPSLALYEIAHKLHAKLARTSMLDPAKLAHLGPDLQHAEDSKLFLDPAFIAHRLHLNKLGPAAAQVAAGLGEVILEAAPATVKRAKLKDPQIMEEGGGLHGLVDAFGDMYPAVLVRLCLRHVQYAIVADTSDWIRPQAVDDFGRLLVECSASSNSVALLLREAASLVASLVDTPETEAIIISHLEPLLEAIADSKRKARGFARETLQSTTAEERESLWESLPLRDIWDDPDLLDLPEYLDILRATAEPVVNASSHPLENPKAWRQWAEQTGWEDTRGKPVPIEDIFDNVFTNLPGHSSKVWLQSAGIIDAEFKLAKKVNRTWEVNSDFGPRFAKAETWPGPPWEQPDQGGSGFEAWDQPYEEPGASADQGEEEDDEEDDEEEDGLALLGDDDDDEMVLGGDGEEESMDTTSK